MSSMSKIGDQIRKNRARLGLSQAELAVRLSVSQSAVGQWERGSVKPRGRLINSLASLFGIPTRELTGEASEPLPQSEKAEAEFKELIELNPSERQQGMAYYDKLDTLNGQRIDSFEADLYDLLGSMLGAANRHQRVSGPAGGVRVADYLSEALLVEFRHPRSLSPAAVNMVKEALWDMSIMKHVLGPGLKYVLVVHTAPMDPHNISSPGIAAVGKHNLELARIDAELMGIRLIMADTPEQAAKTIVDYVMAAEPES